MSDTAASKDKLRTALSAQSDLSFAMLVGSQATGQAHTLSDWDIAIQWGQDVSAKRRIGLSEALRQHLRHVLQVSEESIDLIDLSDARLAMRVLVAEEGQPLCIIDDLAWIRFLQSTWAELEDNDWRRKHAA